MGFKEIKSEILTRRFLKHFLIGNISAVLLIYIVFWMLDIFTHNGEALSVPNFSGLTVRQAQKLAYQKNIRVKVTDSVYAGKAKRGTVIDQNPPADFKVKEGRNIFLTIRSMTPKVIKMPSFIDKPLDEVKSNIETYGLKIGKLNYKPHKYENLVLEQKYKGKQIKEGDSIAKGSKITLVVGRSKGMKNVIVPKILGLTQSEAEKKLTDRNLTVGTVLYDQTVISFNDSINSKIEKQRPVENSSVRPGTGVNIWLSMVKKSDY